jgi:hypothetical protein
VPKAAFGPVKGPAIPTNISACTGVERPTKSKRAGVNRTFNSEITTSVAQHAEKGKPPGLRGAVRYSEKSE